MTKFPVFFWSVTFLQKRDLKSVGNLQSEKFLASGNSGQLLYIGLVSVLLGWA